jgi:protein phosphatase
LIEEAITVTNDKLYEKSKQQADYEGMGTTFVAATICDNVMYVANIGDSRLYVISNEIIQITEDHSLVQAMVKTGELDKDEAKSHPNKNIITRALGTNETAQPDFFEVELDEGDIVLLCSDGLTNMLNDETIEKIIRENADNLQAATEILVKQANENGGKDNITVIIVKV